MIIATAAVLVTLAIIAGVTAVTVLTVPAAAPVAVVGTVLGSVTALFDADNSDGGEMSAAQLAAAGDGDAVSCQLVTAPEDHLDEPPAGEDHGSGLAPIVIGGDGSLDRADAAALLEPLAPGTSTLVAHVWFLYRLAGIGDWDTFVEAYHAAELQPDDESADAPWRQVQTLNTVGARVDRYRLTAASLAAAGQYTGRFHDPYPAYRKLVGLELAATCQGRNQ